MNHILHKSVLLATTIVGLNSGGVAFGQSAGTQASGADVEIIVTARRREERLQDVPISITVFNQQQLDNRNIGSGADLATYTPSLSAQVNFGPENATFALRGFTQEVRTTPSVATYFADVVSPRGSTSLSSGDSPGPGAFFDLQNVQVLKGPQGTLFGRNTTGGAVLLVPQRPTDSFDGYIQATVGDFGLNGVQGVLNIPLTDTLRVRFGVDQQRRDGYIENTGPFGPSRLGDVDYVSWRAGIVADITLNLENYTLFTLSFSDTSGPGTQLFACDTSVPLLGNLCAENLAAQGPGDYSASNLTANPRSTAERWQAINTTTWDVSDNLTIKNIASYAELQGDFNNNVFGLALPNHFVPPPAARGYFTLTEGGVLPGYRPTSQRTYSEELQLQGSAIDDRVQWQAGVYYERSDAINPNGTRSSNFLDCFDPETRTCVNPLGAGFLQDTLYDQQYENNGIYAQGTYALTDQLSLTTGVRYTWDKTTADVYAQNFRNTPPYSADPTVFAPAECTLAWLDPATCRGPLAQESEAPTWVVDLDYKPTDDLLFYGKYSRGYRQGSVNIIGPAPMNVYDPEQVDVYELGAKTRFDAGAVRGTFNAAAFYSDFTDQQIQVAFFSSAGAASPTTGIANAGSSKIWGVELESSLTFFDDFRLDLSYAHLDTQLESAEDVVLPPPYDASDLTTAVGGPLTYSPEDKVTLTGTYTLPVPDNWGEVSAGATYVYTAEQLASSLSSLGIIPSYELVNLNLKWDSIAGSRVDGSLFVTNATDEVYYSYIPGTLGSYGFEVRGLGLPRMAGVRLRVNFGE